MFCVKCGKEYDNANFCPQCGTPTNIAAPQAPAEPLPYGPPVVYYDAPMAYAPSAAPQKQPAHKRWWIWAILSPVIALVLLIIIGLAVYRGNERGGEPAASAQGRASTAAAAEPGVIRVSVEQLLKEYDENSVKADQRYKDKLLEVTGVVDSVEADASNEVYVSLVTGDTWDWNDVHCLFRDSAEIKKLSDISKGDTVTITGTCTGSGFMRVSLKNCRLTDGTAPANKPAATQAESTAAATTAKADGRAIQIEAKQLVDEYDSNAVKADQQYKGMLLAVTGIVDSIDTDLWGDVYVALGSGERWEDHVRCYFTDDAEIAKIANLTPGDKVTITGTGDGGSTFFVDVKNCRMK